MIADLPVLEDYDVLSNFEALSELPVAASCDGAAGDVGEVTQDMKDVSAIGCGKRRLVCRGAVAGFGRRCAPAAGGATWRGPCLPASCFRRPCRRAQRICLADWVDQLQEMRPAEQERFLRNNLAFP